MVTRAAGPFADTEAIARWQQRYQQQLALAADEGGRRAKRLQHYGQWGDVSLDTFLLFVVEIALNIVLAAAAFAVILIDGRYLSIYRDTNTAVRHAADALQSWLLSPVGLSAGGLAVQLSVVLVLLWRLVGPGIMSWADLGFGPELRRAPGRSLAIGLGLGLVAFVGSEALLVGMQAIGLNVKGQEEVFKSAKHAGILSFIPFAVTVAVTAPLAEEAFFRGYALRAATVRYGFPIGLLISSALFALLHLAGSPQVGWVTLALFFVGAVLGWGYARTGSLITNITAHAVNNIIGLVLLYHG